MNTPSDFGIDPSSYRVVEPESPWANPEDELGRDAFMRLLVAQLENQDPLEPQKDAEFVAQLATFSSLEQLMDMNKRITTLAELQEAVLTTQTQMMDSQAIGMIGQQVLVSSKDQLALGPDGAEPIVYDLTRDHSALTVEIRDAAGALVRSVRLSDEDQTSAGRHAFQWDGRRDDGSEAAEGTYDIKLMGADGTALTTFVPLKIEGLHIGPEGLSFVTNGRAIVPADIAEIRGKDATIDDLLHTPEERTPRMDRSLRD